MGDSSLFGEDWLAAQRRFWEQLSATASDREGATQPQGAASVEPWQAVLETWWQQLQPATPLLVREVLEKMLAQGQQLFQLAELYTRAGQTSLMRSTGTLRYRRLLPTCAGSLPESPAA